MAHKKGVGAANKTGKFFWGAEGKKTKKGRVLKEKIVTPPPLAEKHSQKL